MRRLLGRKAQEQRYFDGLSFTFRGVYFAPLRRGNHGWIYTGTLNGEVVEGREVVCKEEVNRLLRRQAETC
jgi:hypothetical protein